VQTLQTTIKNNANILQTIQNDANILQTVNKTLQCSICLKIFTHRNSKYRHEKMCKQKNIVIQNNQDNKTINNTIINGNLNTGTVNNTTVNNTTINYIINPVGCENIDKLTFELSVFSKEKTKSDWKRKTKVFLFPR
jgi:hypothetical protein